MLLLKMHLIPLSYQAEQASQKLQVPSVIKTQFLYAASMSLMHATCLSVILSLSQEVK